MGLVAGDVNSIRIGENTNIQDGAIVHVAKHNAQGREMPTLIGSNVTIGRQSSVPTLAQCSMLCNALQALSFDENEYDRFEAEIMNPTLQKGSAVCMTRSCVMECMICMLLTKHPTDRFQAETLLQ